MNAHAYFRSIAPELAGRYEWDDEDRNLGKINAAAEKLTQAALNSGKFDNVSAADLNDAATEYVSA